MISFFLFQSGTSKTQRSSNALKDLLPPAGSPKRSCHRLPLLRSSRHTQSPQAWPWTMAGVQSYARPPHHPEELVQSPLSPTASLTGICLLAIYQRWAAAIKGIPPQGHCPSISTIKLDSGAASRALHRRPVSNGHPGAPCCPFLSTVQRHRHSKIKEGICMVTTRLASTPELSPHTSDL